MLALEIDAAVKKLISYALEDGDSMPEFDLEAAETIIDTCRLIPDSGGKRFYKRHTKIRMQRGGITTGYTKEAGDVTIQDDKGRIEVEENSFGFKEARFGHYKFYRFGRRIYFRHYWAADISAEGIDRNRQEFYLIFNEQTFAPARFGFKTSEIINNSTINSILDFATSIKSFIYYILSFGNTRLNENIRFSRSVHHNVWTSDS